MTTTTPNPTPILNGRVIGQAERATRAVLDRLLAEHHIGFETSVAINLLEQAGGREDSDDLIARMLDGLRIPEVDVWAAVDDARRRGFIAGTDVFELTAEGQRCFDEIQVGIAAITGRLYADLPADDLAVAARVLLTITDRAKAELDVS